MKTPSDLPVETQTQLLVEIQKIIWPTQEVRAVNNSDDATTRDLESFDAIVALLAALDLAPIESSLVECEACGDTMEQ